MCRPFVSVLSWLGFCMGMIPRYEPIVHVIDLDDDMDIDDTVEVAMDWDILSL